MGNYEKMDEDKDEAICDCDGLTRGCAQVWCVIMLCVTAIGGIVVACVVSRICQVNQCTYVTEPVSYSFDGRFGPRHERGMVTPVAKGMAATLRIDNRPFETKWWPGMTGDMMTMDMEYPFFFNHKTGFQIDIIHGLCPDDDQRMSVVAQQIAASDTPMERQQYVESLGLTWVSNLDMNVSATLHVDFLDAQVCNDPRGSSPNVRPPPDCPTFAYCTYVMNMRAFSTVNETVQLTYDATVGYRKKESKSERSPFFYVAVSSKIYLVVLAACWGFVAVALFVVYFFEYHCRPL